MSVSLGALGSIGGGTTSCTPGFPAVSAGDLLVLMVGNKYPTNGPSTPAGWTLLAQETGGNGSAGADSGTVYVTLFTKIADGTESGTLTVSVPAANACGARIFSFTKSSGEAFQQIRYVTMQHNTPGSTVAATSTARMNVKNKDFLWSFTVFNTDAFTYSNQQMTMPFITTNAFSERWEGNSASGDDLAFIVCSQRVIGGDTTGFMSYTIDSSGANAVSPAGASIIIGLRSSASYTNDNSSRRRYVVTRLNKKSPRMENILEDLYEPRKGRS